MTQFYWFLCKRIIKVGSLYYSKWLDYTRTSVNGFVRDPYSYLTWLTDSETVGVGILTWRLLLLPRMFFLDSRRWRSTIFHEISPCLSSTVDVFKGLWRLWSGISTRNVNKWEIPPELTNWSQDLGSPLIFHFWL